MDSARRAAIRRRLEATSLSPWLVQPATFQGWVVRGPTVLVESYDDAVFIAASHQDVPALLAALEAADVRAEALIEKLARVRRLLIDGASDAGILMVDGHHDRAYQRLRGAVSDALAKELTTSDVQRAYAALSDAAPQETTDHD